MKIVLLQDVAGVGKKYDVKNVADGYAINFLIPKKVAQTATSQMVEKLKIEKLQNEEEKEVQENLMAKNLESLNGAKVVIKAKANEKGHLFDGIYKPEMTEILREQLHIEIPEEYIELEKHIKSIGEHKVSFKFKDKKVEVVVEVVAA